MKPAVKVLLSFIAFSALGFGSAVATEKKRVNVFILAGQSNMEGHGFVAADPQRNGGRGSLEFVVKNPATAPHFATAPPACSTPWASATASITAPASFPAVNASVSPSRAP